MADLRHRPILWSDVDLADPLRRAWPSVDQFVQLEAPGPLESLSEATIVVAARLRLGREQFAMMPKLMLVSCWGVGHDHVDLAVASARAIPVTINPVFSLSVAEAAVTLLLALFKRLPQLTAAARAPHVGIGAPGESSRNLEIGGRPVGIVGFGRIGRVVGEFAHGLGMTVLAADPALAPADVPDWCTLVDLDTLLPAVDAVVLVAPLAESTFHLIDARRLQRMRQGAFLVNVGRGGLVDEKALLQSLQGHLGGAGLDVWESEPVDGSNPLLQLTNVIGTPHALAKTQESLERICASIARNVMRVLRGEPPENVVNREVMA